MRYWQKLGVPELINLEKDLEFVIVTDIDLSEMKNNLIFMKGKYYDYEDGIVEEIGIKEIQYSVDEDGNSEIDENGNYIDWEE